MRKIYPPLAVLVLYGLLTIAVTTLAQSPFSGEQCISNNEVASQDKRVTVGYVQLFPNQPNPINPDEIPWESYDFINVIAYPNPKNAWNNIHRPSEDDIGKGVLNPIKNLKSPNHKTKILLSIRNYDVGKWPNDAPAEEEEKEYTEIINETVNTIKQFELDGVDIEYPGMRGIICHIDPELEVPVWNQDEKDEAFVKFIKDLRFAIVNAKIGKKTIMVTAGSVAMKKPDDLVDSIDFLNIETHHHSLYQNIKTPQKDNFVSSFPNAPFQEFQNAHKEWIDAGFSNDKIIMGIDFGNTLQVVSNQAIENGQTVLFNSPPFDPDLRNINVQVKIDQNLKLINNICPGDGASYNKIQLYSWPWKYLSSSALDPNNCEGKSGWTRKYDPQSKTPWIYRKDTEDPDYYYYASYEDFNSLYIKLNYSMSKGISISDVSYDDGSLLKFIHGKGAKSPDPEESPNPDSGNGDPSSNSTDPVKADGNENNLGHDPKKTPAGKIAGGVIGGLLCLIILGACAFIGYRYRKKPKSESFRSLLMSIPSSFKNHSTASRNTEMTSDPSPNLFAPQTTVIPVASGYVTAMFDFTGKEENDLSFKKGDKIEVLERGDGPNDWWVGRVNGAVGEFPGNYVKET